MKNTLRVISLALVVIMMVAILASCGGPSGTYGSDAYSLKFSGSKVTVNAGDKQIMTGKFEMGKSDNGNKTIKFTMDDPDEDLGILEKTAYTAAKLVFDGTKSYNEGKDDHGSYIEIGGLKYYKK